MRDLIGVKYKPHGRDLKDGLDCYGLAIVVLGREGINLPDVFYKDTNRETNNKIMRILENGISHEKIDAPEKNCIIELTVCGIPSHIGVYIGNGEFIHCLKGYGVVIDKLYKWEGRIKGYYRVNG
jgi:cell wall-associated NlpC family hydrolase